MRFCKGQILKGGKLAGTNYLRVTLRQPGKLRIAFVHHLVAEAFLGERPQGAVICHNDSRLENNAATNLRYDSQAGNLADRHENGTHPAGVRNSNAVLDDASVIAIRAASGTHADIAEMFGVCPATIHNIKARKSWRHVA